MWADRRRLALVVVLAPLACDPFPSFDGLTSDAASATDVATKDVAMTDSSPSTDAGACDADLSASPDNCGACGHGCLGGGCEAGRCLPVALVTNEPAPYGLAIDDTRVYWTQYIDGGAVRSVDKSGDAATLVTVVGGLAVPEFIAVDSADVYLTMQGGPLVRVPKTGSPNAAVLTPSYAELHDLTVDDTAVYFCDREVDGGVYYLLKDGGAPVLLAAGNQPGSIAVDATNAYWTEWGSGSGPGQVKAQAKQDPQGTTRIVAYDQSFPDDIAVDDTAVYFTHFTNPGGVSKALLSGTASPFVLDSTMANTNGIVLDGTQVYFTSYSMATVNRVSTSGGPAITLDQETIGNPIRIAVDDRAIYWTVTATAGVVYRLAK